MARGPSDLKWNGTQCNNSTNPICTFTLASINQTVNAVFAPPVSLPGALR